MKLRDCIAFVYLSQLSITHKWKRACISNWSLQWTIPPLIHFYISVALWTSTYLIFPSSQFNYSKNLQSYPVSPVCPPFDQCKLAKGVYILKQCSGLRFQTFTAAVQRSSKVVVISSFIYFGWLESPPMSSYESNPYIYLSCATCYHQHVVCYADLGNAWYYPLLFVHVGGLPVCWGSGA